MRILVLGFFDRGNIGDEIFRIVYQTVFATPALEFDYASIDDQTEPISGYDAVVLAGGDVINATFFDKLLGVGLDQFTGPKYAFSVGVPYESCIPYLDIFDKVILRSSADYNAVAQRLGADNVQVLPDFATLLPQQAYVAPRSDSLTKVAVCLARPIVKDKYLNYERVVDTIAEALDQLATDDDSLRFFLIPFNTYKQSPNECDLLINADVAQRCRVAICESVVESDWSLPTYQRWFKEIDYVIGMRYHSLILSLLHGKRFVSLFTTRKVKTLLADLNMAACGLPLTTAFTAQQLVQLFNGMRQDASPFTPTISQASLKRTIKAVNTILTALPRRTVGAVFMSCADKEAIVESAIKGAYDMFHITNPEWALQSVLNSEQMELAGRFIVHRLTGDIQSPSLYGLLDNMQHQPDFDLREASKWILENHLVTGSARTNATVSDSGVINMAYMNQGNFRGVHRSGWAYVIDGLEPLNTDNPTAPYLDLYIDRTFHWSAEVLQEEGIIPYKHEWIGFLHHTFDTTYSMYNCTVLFENPLFLQSLQTCTGLIVLSAYLQEQTSEALTRVGFGEIPVFILTHPTEIPDETLQFTYAKWAQNADKLVVQIGAWLRDPYMLYTLDVPDNVTKAALQGRGMGDQFIPSDFMGKLEALCITDNTPVVPGSICRDPLCEDMICSDVGPSTGSSPHNKYLRGLIRYAKQNESSVRKIAGLSNQDYDTLLSDNVIFLHLVDASAVNTVLEAFARNTPIIVNRLPALVELLGNEYPLFYDTAKQAQGLLDDLDTSVRKATAYLARLDKSPIVRENFLAQFRSIVAYISSSVVGGL